MTGTKYVILLGDGMPDWPIAEMDGKTPLNLAATTNLDRMARDGAVGSVRTTPEGFYPGSDITNMGILGYDPKKYYTGRAPLEAAAMGLKLGPKDMAFRCNLVTLKPVADGLMMEDFSAGHIETEDSAKLIADMDKAVGGGKVSFHPGVSYRHIMVIKNGAAMAGMRLTPPHDISDQNIREHMPKGDGAEEVLRITNEAQMFLKTHKVNVRRVRDGKKEANSVWLWGQGLAPSMPALSGLRGIKGAMITAVDLMRGIAKLAGMKVIDVPGATGWIDTNYEGKAAACLKALEEVDLVYLHVESPDESGHAGSLEYKIQAITDFDRKVVGPVLEGIKRYGDYRVMALSDHPTPLAIKTHTTDPVPFAIYPRPAGSPAIEGAPESADKFDEGIVKSSPLKFDNAVSLFEYFTRK
ncbi:MAG: cofactor-independent phosphoglycerate mutase [Nitrospinota bacterium]|nr:cofactor-independent phosphoglycerate mutase [Nitrospinota bacterium]